MARQPGQHFEMFVRGIVVEDDVDQLASPDLALDGIEETDKFAVAVALHAAADHRPSSTLSAANRVVVPWRL
jgi:hypothetical protein